VFRILFFLLFSFPFLLGQRGELIVVIAVDQMRGDYPSRFTPFWSNHGFQRFFREGVYFTHCFYDHANNLTGPGHACISTGTYPYQHGITGNEVYENDRYTYCVSDSTSPLPHDPQRGYSPKRLLKPTIGDWLRHHHPDSKVISLAIKDRVAILLGGKNPTYAIWFDSKLGKYTTSSYYKEPKWLSKQEEWGIYQSHIGKKWELSAKPENRLPPDDQPWEPEKKNTFPHPILSPTDYICSPFAISDLFTLAKKVIEMEKLGKNGNKDMLFIGISSTDYIGHIYGPDSREIYEIYSVLDSLLAGFLEWLDRLSITYKSVLISDHGVCPVPEQLRHLYYEESWRGTPDSILLSLNQIIQNQFHLDYSFFRDLIPPYLYVTAKGKSDPLYEQILTFTATYLADHYPEIRSVYTRTQIEQAFHSPSLKEDTLLRSILLDYHPREFGDLYLLVKPYSLIEGHYLTTHGTPYAYDSHVPLAFYWKGIKPKRVSDKVSPVDIFPTLCEWLKLPLPEYLDGKSLNPYF